MKLQLLKPVILIVFLAFTASSLKAQNKFQVPENLKGFGLIAELAYTKSVTEQYTLAIINSKQYSNSEKHEVKAAYIPVKIAYDQILNQLIVDIKSKNCLRVYRKLDKWLKYTEEERPKNDTATIIRPYVTNLKLAKGLLTSFNDIIKKLEPRTDEEMKTEGFVKELAELFLEPAIEITGLVLEIKEKKIDAVCEMLAALRLANLDAKDGKKDEDKE